MVEDDVRPNTKKGKRKAPARGKKRAAEEDKEEDEEMEDLTEDDDVRPTTKKGKRKAPARGKKQAAEVAFNKAKGKAPRNGKGRGAKNSKRVMVQVVVEEEEEVQITPPSSPSTGISKTVADAEALLARKGVSTARPNRPLIPPWPVAKPPANNPFNDSDSDSENDDKPLSGRTRKAKHKKDQEKLAKLFPNWRIESEEPRRTVQVQVESDSDSDQEYDRIVKEKESMPTGTKKNSGGNSSGTGSDSGSEWEKDAFEKLSKHAPQRSKFSNTSKIVLVSPIPSPLKGGLRPLKNDSGVALLRTRAKTAQLALSKEDPGTSTSSDSGVKSPNDDGELSLDHGAGDNQGKFIFWYLHTGRW